MPQGPGSGGSTWTSSRIVVTYTFGISSASTHSHPAAVTLRLHTVSYRWQRYMQTMSNAMTSAKNSPQSCCVSNVHVYFSSLLYTCCSGRNLGVTETRRSTLPFFRPGVAETWLSAGGAACGTECKQTCVNAKPYWLKNKTIIFTSGVQQRCTLTYVKTAWVS